VSGVDRGIALEPERLREERERATHEKRERVPARRRERERDVSVLLPSWLAIRECGTAARGGVDRWIGEMELGLGKGGWWTPSRPGWLRAAIGPLTKLRALPGHPACLGCGPGTGCSFGPC